MASVELRDRNNQKLEDLQLVEEVFAAPRHDHVVYEEVRRFLATRRAGTHATKTRAQVSGGGKKPWRQKGTGRARHGSIRSPLWKGGGIVHGPQPRDYSYSIPRKVKKQAMRVALSEKLRDQQLTVVDKLELEAPKTKLFDQLIRQLEVEREALVVDDASNEALRRAARNHPRAKVVSPNALNVYDVLRFDRLIMSRSALDRVTEIFRP